MICPGLDRGANHFRSAAQVKRQHLHAQLDRRFNRAGDGIRDIVQFEIEKNFRAGSRNFAHDRGTGSGVKLQSDFEKRNLIAQLLDQSQSLLFRWDVERDDDFVGESRHCLKAQGAAVSRPPFTLIGSLEAAAP